MLYFLITLFSLVCFSGCAKKQPVALKQEQILSENAPDKNKLITKSSHKALNDEKKYNEKAVFKTKPIILKQKTYKQIEAGLVDIPTPLLAQPIRARTDEKGSYQLEYLIALSVEKVALFYTAEMARSGWDQGLAFSSDEQTVLSFKKHNGSCVILLMPKKSWWSLHKKTQVFLYVS